MIDRRRRLAKALLGVMTSAAFLTSIGCGGGGDDDVTGSSPSDGDGNGPTVELVASDNEAREDGDTAILTVSLSAPAAASLTINYSVSSDSTASPGIDYEELSGTAFVTAGESSVDISIIPIDDTETDGIETIIVSLDAGVGYGLGAMTTATIDMLSDDGPPATITTATPTVAENGAAGSFTIRLSTIAEEDVVVGYAVLASSTATPDSDYQALSKTATIPSGSDFVDVTIQPIDDGLIEGDERIELRLLTVSGGYEVNSPNHATITLTSDDLPTVTIEATDDQASENGDDGTFLISLDFALLYELEISYGTSGTADVGLDYNSLSGGVTIPAGETTAVITIEAVHDFEIEETETVTLTIAANSSYNVGPQSEAILSIDDYVFPTELPLVTLTVPDDNANENGDTGTIMVSIDRILTYDLAVEIVPFYVLFNDILAMPGVDYEMPPSEVTIRQGEISATITIIPIQDEKSEPEELVRLQVVPRSTYATPIFQEDTFLTGHVILVDDEPLPTVRLMSRDSSASEAGDTASFTVEIDHSMLTPLTVYYKMHLQGTSGTWWDDAELLPGSIVIPANQTSATQIVTAINDELPEGTEGLYLSLVDTPDYGIAPKSARVLINVVSDEQLPLATIEVTDPRASEEGLDPAELVIHLDTHTLNDLTIQLSYGSWQVPVLGEDFEVPGALVDYGENGSQSILSVTIPEGESSVRLAVVPIDDTEPEGTEKIRIDLLPGEGYSIPGYSEPGRRGTVHLDSDETRPTVSVFTKDSFASEAGDNMATFMLTLDRASATDLEIPCYWSGSATEGDDYLELPDTIIIPAEHLEFEINVTALDDDQLEGVESISIWLNEFNDEAAYTISNNFYADVYIESDEEGPVATLVVTDPVANRNGTDLGACKVLLDRPAPENLTINYIFGISYSDGGQGTISSGTYRSITIPRDSSSFEIQVNGTAPEELTEISVTLEEGEGYALGSTTMGQFHVLP